MVSISHPLGFQLTRYNLKQNLDGENLNLSSEQLKKNPSIIDVLVKYAVQLVNSTPMV